MTTKRNMTVQFDTNKMFDALKADFTQRGEQISDLEIAEQTYRVAKTLITAEQLQTGKRLLQQHRDAFFKDFNEPRGTNPAGDTVDDEEALQILVEPDDISPQFADIRRQVFGQPA